MVNVWKKNNKGGKDYRNGKPLGFKVTPVDGASLTRHLSHTYSRGMCACACVCANVPMCMCATFACAYQNTYSSLRLRISLECTHHIPNRGDRKSDTHFHRDHRGAGTCVICEWQTSLNKRKKKICLLLSKTYEKDKTLAINTFEKILILVLILSLFSFLFVFRYYFNLSHAEGKACIISSASMCFASPHERRCQMCAYCICIHDISIY